MIQPDVLVVFFNLDHNGTPNLPNVDLPTFAENAVYTRNFQAKVICDRLKVAADLV
jgi:hypothetical protein